MNFFQQITVAGKQSPHVIGDMQYMDYMHLSVHTYQHTGIHTKVSVQLQSPPHHNEVIIGNKDNYSLEDAFPLHEGNQCGRYRRLCAHTNCLYSMYCMYSRMCMSICVCMYVRMHL